VTDHLLVLMGDRVAGTLTQRGQTLSFAYGADYAEDRDSTPLSLSMPLAIETYAGTHLSNWLWGLLPDNSRVIDEWCRQFSVSPSTPYGLLGSAVGEDCPGAIRFVRPRRLAAVLDGPATVEPLTERDIERRLDSLRRDGATWLGTRFDGRFSLAGAQAKTALVFRDGVWGDARGSAATTHIIKPAVALERQDIVEHVCLDAARRVGLPAAESRIMQFGDERAIVVERYDRQVRDGIVSRFHQEDLCQALGRAPGEKYQVDGGPRPRDITDLFRRSMTRRASLASSERFVGALAWNWIIVGTDAHAKNYSVLLSGGEALLAPLYDVASILPYEANPYHLRLAMKVGGTYDAVVRADPWPETARDLGMDADRVHGLVSDIAGRARAAFTEAIAAAGLDGSDLAFAERLLTLVEARLAQCRAVL
jgi:serine/threonine-protein kinase HipA